MFEDIINNNKKELLPSKEVRLKLMIDFFDSDIWKKTLKNGPTIEELINDLKDILKYLETGEKPE